MLCPKCYKSNPDYNDQCDYCGYWFLDFNTDTKVDSDNYTDTDVDTATDIDTDLNESTCYTHTSDDTGVDYSIDYSSYSKSAAESIQKTKQKRTALFLLFIIVCAVGVFFLYKNTQNEDTASSRYVAFVKNGTFNDYPDRSIGEAFDSYFADGSWSEFTSSDGSTVVEFRGRCLYGGVSGILTMQYEIYSDDSFEIVYADFDDDPLSFFEIGLAVDAIMTD